MPSGSVRHQNRHFKTLIVLVLAMTSGTFLLFWVAQVAPVTPLKGKTLSTKAWTEISVRANAASAPRGFFHYRIDHTGRLFQSNAWTAGQHDRGHPGAIHVLLTCPDYDMRVSPSQAKTLSQIISKLRHDHAIASDKVQVDATEGVVDSSQPLPRRLRRT
ncbi:MAG: hypothetical protein MI923_25340 [Phycisphaerales bacterium]|nr:hypothetical protein [Phycisphaerales bacterium]